MITTILQKVIDELNKPSPDLSYIKGMVEVLLASQPKEVEKLPAIFSPEQITKAKEALEKPTDEASILDAKAKAAIETIKGLAKVEME